MRWNPKLRKSGAGLLKGCMLLVGLVLGGCGEATGLARPLDGTSIDNFNQSVTQLEHELSAAEFRRFRSALNYLQVHALEHDSVAGFYRSLDGKTATAIIQTADDQRAEEQ